MHLIMLTIMTTLLGLLQYSHMHTVQANSCKNFTGGIEKSEINRNQSYFLICGSCFWCASCFDLRSSIEICPSCMEVK
jgi:hypothetical protein